MHNILLQGIIGHMDLNDVYKRVHTLMSNINLRDGKKGRVLIWTDYYSSELYLGSCWLKTDLFTRKEILCFNCNTQD